MSPLQLVPGACLEQAGWTGARGARRKVPRGSRRVAVEQSEDLAVKGRGLDVEVGQEFA